jgi:hypothetical protein
VSATPPDQANASSPSPYPPQTLWEFGYIGFDTEKRLWFVQFFNETNQNVGTYLAKTVVVKRGRAAQYEWKDLQGKANWHVRERFLGEDVQAISVDATGNRLTITFKESPKETKEDFEAPPSFSYVLYAFHLQNKDILKGNRAPLGFVEFYDEKGEVIRRMNNRRIIVEDIDRKSVGEYPNIRLRIEGKDVERVLCSRTAVIIQGKKPA